MPVRKHPKNESEKRTYFSISTLSIISFLSLSSIIMFWYLNPSVTNDYLAKLSKPLDIQTLMEEYIPQSLSLLFYSSIVSTKKSNQDSSQSIPLNQKIIAIGDLHGDYKNALQTFMMAGIANKEGNWIAGKTIFVQTGVRKFLISHFNSTGYCR